MAKTLSASMEARWTSVGDHGMVLYETMCSETPETTSSPKKAQKKAGCTPPLPGARVTR